jgi:hypothetical protein
MKSGLAKHSVVFSSTKELPSRHDEIRAQKCDKLVVGLTQWPGSYDHGKPMQFQEYYEDLNNAIQLVKEEFSDLEVFLSSVHVNSLMSSVVQCPPGDWRTPAVMEGYNNIIQQICREKNVTFLDSSFLSEPLWDSRPDWNHLGGNEKGLEAVYLTARALGVVDR